MAWDSTIAGLLRSDLAGVATAERAMFGGLGFFLGDHLVACAQSDGALFRPGKTGIEAALAIPGTTRMTMGARVMRGWLHADRDACADAARRARLIALSLNTVRAIGPK